MASFRATLDRSIQAVPPKRLQDYQFGCDRENPRILYCFTNDCPRCQRFKRHRNAFEKERGWKHVIPWDCSEEKGMERKMAVKLGAGDIPTFVVIYGPGTTPEVVEPP